MDAQGRDLAETVWTRIDRKAGAVIELTIRQLRHKISTWVVLALGTMLMVLLLAFYIRLRNSNVPVVRICAGLCARINALIAPRQTNEAGLAG